MLAAAGAAVLALCWSPPAPASADISLTPTPTPCTLPPPLTCTVPTPPPVVSSSPTPTGAPAPSSGGSTGSSGPASTTPSKGSGGGTAASGAVAGGLSLADVQVLQTTLGNSALVEQLVAILQNPTGAQRPDLLHFQPAAAVTHALAPRPRAVLLIVVLLAIPLLWIAAVPLLDLRRRPIAVLATLAPALVVGCLVVPAFAAKPVAAVKAAPRRAAAPPLWTRLVAIEKRLSGERVSLVTIEARLERLTAELETDQPGQRVHPQVFATLAAMHDADSAVYEQDLEREYQVYLAAAQEPQLSAQLRQGAAASGLRAASGAVAANLLTVQTQMQQEAAISQAQARLQQLGFTPAQAEALQSHDTFVAPLGGPVGQPFGPTSFALEPPLVYNGQFYPHFHTGLDIEAPMGAPVVAAADGVVALVATSTDGHGHTTGYGTYVVIAHAHGYYTLYAHLSGVLVKAGQLVRQGQPVGLVGTTGNSTGPHLHFEIRKDGQFLDPLPYVTGRLKPW